ncbi:MAG: hypothetical protein OCD00_13370 [Colwellia sp.]
MANIFSIESLRQNKALIIIMLFNIASSVLHYVHNIVYFADYPEPEWMTPHIVDYFWFVMTPIGLWGVVCELKNNIRKANVLLFAYALMSLLSLLHYGVDTDKEITLSIHAFIWIESCCALMLIVYLKWRSVFKFKFNVLDKNTL